MIVLHLVRRELPPGVAAADDWIVRLDRLELVAHGSPPRAPGSLDHDAVVALIAAADRVVTW
jgi:hypothetical protein